MGFKKHKGNTDGNHKLIIEALEKHGYQVISLHTVGKGCPDLLVSKHDDMWLVEIKNGEKAKLKPSQIEFIKNWRGNRIIIVRSIEDISMLWSN